MMIATILNSLVLVSLVLANNWKTYPAVPKSFTINGFADPVYDGLPECAKNCVTMKNPTVCPDFDSGCFCVMRNWNALVAKCLIDSCKANDISQASSVIMSMCDRVGARTWALPADISTSIASAMDVKQVDASTTSDGATTTRSTSTTTTSSNSSNSSSSSASSASSSSSARAASGAVSSAPAATTTSSSTPASSSSSAPASSSTTNTNIAAKSAIGAIGLVAVLPLLV